MLRGPEGSLFSAFPYFEQFEFVDKERIALAGFSWGAMVAVFASRDIWAARLSPGPRFAAAVAFYPSCATIRPPSGNAYEVVSTDIDRPLLVLMGEKDVETPPAECVPKLEAAKASTAPVEWHVYPDKTHCCDCRNLDGVSKVDIRGPKSYIGTIRTSRTILAAACSSSSTRRLRCAGDGHQRSFARTLTTNFEELQFNERLVGQRI